MGRKLNLLHQQFGKLQVIAETDKRKNNSVVWQCQCECGNIVEYSTKELRSDGIIQCPRCGHNRQPKTNLLEDIIGKEFGQLKVLENTGKRNDHKIVYKCQCNCIDKGIVYATRTDLKTGKVSCCMGESHKYKYALGDIVGSKKIIGYGYSDNIERKHYWECECLECHSIFYCADMARVDSCGCLVSKGEQEIKKLLNANNIRYISQFSFPGSRLRYDFAIYSEDNKVSRLIEFDGEQHFYYSKSNNGWNTKEHFDRVKRNDSLKNKMAYENNIPLIRIPYYEREHITLELLMGNKYLYKGENENEFC